MYVYKYMQYSCNTWSVGELTLHVRVKATWTIIDPWSINHLSDRYQIQLGSCGVCGTVHQVSNQAPERVVTSESDGDRRVWRSGPPTGSPTLFLGTKKAEVISLEKNENQKARGDVSVVFVFLR